MDNLDIPSILKRIDNACAERGLSKTEFYKESGISSANFSQWNTGVHRPTKKKLACAAEVLDVNLEWLLYGRSETKKAPATQKGSGLDDELIARLLLLTPEEQKKVDAFVQGLLASR